MAKRRFRSGGRFRRLRRRRGGLRSKRLRKFVKRTVRSMSEIKWATISNSVATIDPANGTSQSINPAFVNGNSKTSRIGNKIRYKFLQFRLNFQVTAISGTVYQATQTTRIIIFQPRIILFANPQSPTITETLLIFASPSDRVISSIDNTRCRILMDRTYLLSPLGFYTSTGLPTAGRLKMKKRVNNNVSFISGNSFPQEPKDTYYIAIFTDVSLPNTNSMTIQFNSRMSFYDI